MEAKKLMNPVLVYDLDGHIPVHMGFLGSPPASQPVTDNIYSSMQRMSWHTDLPILMVVKRPQSSFVALGVR
jgi:hypothetical protein